MLLRNTVWEKENGRPSCCHLSARKKTRDNHDFNPQSSCLMPQASCTANRAFSLWRINVRTNVMSRNSWPWVRHTLIHGWINPAMGEILQDHLRKKKTVGHVKTCNPALSVDNRSRMLTPCASCAQVGFYANAGQKCNLSLPTISGKRFFKPMIEIYNATQELQQTTCLLASGLPLDPPFKSS